MKNYKITVTPKSNINDRLRVYYNLLEDTANENLKKIKDNNTTEEEAEIYRTWYLAISAAKQNFINWFPELEVE